MRGQLHHLRCPRELQRVVCLGRVRFHLQLDLQEVQQRLHSIERLLRVDRVSERDGLQRGEMRLPFWHQGVQRRLHRHDRLLRKQRMPGERYLFRVACLHLQQPVQGLREQLHRELGLLQQLGVYRRTGNEVLHLDSAHDLRHWHLRQRQLLVPAYRYALRWRLSERCVSARCVASNRARRFRHPTCVARRGVDRKPHDRVGRRRRWR